LKNKQKLTIDHILLFSQQFADILLMIILNARYIQ